MTTTNTRSEALDLADWIKQNGLYVPALYREEIESALRALAQQSERDEALMRQAAEALESLFSGQADADRAKRCSTAITALRERLAEQK